MAKSIRAAGSGPDGPEPLDAPNGKTAEVLAEKIGLLVVERGWPVGEIVGSEAELMERYQVSRATLREAARLLEHDRVAAMRRGPGGGLIVTEPDESAVVRAAALYLDQAKVEGRDLFEARIALEMVAVRELADNLTEEKANRLWEVYERESRFGTHLDPSVHNLHREIAVLSGNAALRLFIDVLTALTASQWLGVAAIFGSTEGRAFPSETISEMHSVHAKIIEAIVVGNSGLAQHRMLVHLRAMRDASRRAIQEDPAPPDAAKPRPSRKSGPRASRNGQFLTP